MTLTDNGLEFWLLVDWLFQISVASNSKVLGPELARYIVSAAQSAHSIVE